MVKRFGFFECRFEKMRHEKEKKNYVTLKGGGLCLFPRCLRAVVPLCSIFCDVKRCPEFEFCFLAKKQKKLRLLLRLEFVT